MSSLAIRTRVFELFRIEIVLNYKLFHNFVYVVDKLVKKNGESKSNIIFIRQKRFWPPCEMHICVFDSFYSNVTSYAFK